MLTFTLSCNLILAMEDSQSPQATSLEAGKISPRSGNNPFRSPPTTSPTRRSNPGVVVFTPAFAQRIDAAERENSRRQQETIRLQQAVETLETQLTQTQKKLKEVTSCGGLWCTLCCGCIPTDDK